LAFALDAGSSIRGTFAQPSGITGAASYSGSDRGHSYGEPPLVEGS
jgi:hypothetical protein